MCGLVFLWGLDYIFAKAALTLLEPLTLLFLKYCIGALVLLGIKLKLDRKTIVRKKDIPFFFLCAIVGEVCYFFCEYSSLDYLPVSCLTMILAFVPVVSIILERIIFKRKFNMIMLVGILASIAGVGLIIGTDLAMLISGRMTGYLFAFGAVLAWNMFSFITNKVGENYSGVTMSFNQILCTVIILIPYAIHSMPPIDSFTPEIIGGIIYLGTGSAGIGYFIFIKGIQDLGPTISSMFSNFIPVTATLFGWLLLGESVTGVQLIGGVIIIAASCLVIVEKGKMEVRVND
ncbi:MAG: EamA family transporter [Eubacterium sp.]|nr:EamA family transporter [Candidatus Colimonas fimequi]